MSEVKDPLRYFRLEAREISAELGRTVLALEKAPVPGQVERLLRLAHTLKGAAAVVRQRPIAAEAHALEDALVPLRAPGAAAGAAEIERILGHSDAIAALVAALGENQRPAAAAADEPAMGTGEAESLAEMLSEAGLLIRAARGGTALTQQACRLCARLAEALDGAAPGARARGLAAELQQTLERLDRGLAGSLERAGQEVTQAHAAAERLGLSACGAVLAPVERAVRDTAAPLGKEVAFAAIGAETRLDARVLALMQRALLQLARNAVAHGIETVAERLAAGKPRQGLVEIRIARQGSRILFTCRDDGRGIDIAAVRRAARAAGRLAGNEGDDDLVGLLFKGGVSTSGAVTELSGRGVGLDIVRDVAARLGGEFRARTEPGRGTEIALSVPASLAAMEALLVEAGDAVCAIPLEAVRASLQVPAGALTSTPEGERLDRDGTVIPFVPLWRILGRRGPQAGGAALAFLAGSGPAQAAIGVERLLGIMEIVVRPLPEFAACADPVVAGASLDPEGIPRLVLEPRALVAAALGPRGQAAAPGQAAGPPPPILVIDDSLTTRGLEQSILESAGYEVELATCAEEALAKARRRRYGLFLVDVEMPGMDGFAFIRAIRADPELRAIPAILVTSLNAPEDRARGADAGAQAYVVKSEFNQGEVLETIRRCLAAAA